MNIKDLPLVRQSATDSEFVQNPYPFYEAARRHGGLVFWEDYGLPAALSFAAVSAVLRDRRFGREPIKAQDIKPYTSDFYAVEANSMLELEPPRHTRLRGLVLRAFTQRRIAGLAPEIESLCHQLVDDFPDESFDLIEAYCQKVPLIVIARLLGVPESMSDQLLAWSNAMVTMYQARRNHDDEVAANSAARAFSSFLRDYVRDRHKRPSDDLITELIAAEDGGTRLSIDELISTCILLLNAGHEATVHTLGNGVKALLEHGDPAHDLEPDRIEQSVEEVLRFDPPLHMFSRQAYEDVEVMGCTFRRGEQIALLLGAANRDPAVWPEPSRFHPGQSMTVHTSFGAGIHFCVGAPLARLELQIAMRVLFERCPKLHITETPRYANLYHFHGLEHLIVET